jgi:Protein of unknown function (DUF1579)
MRLLFAGSLSIDAVHIRRGDDRPPSGVEAITRASSREHGAFGAAAPTSWSVSMNSMRYICAIVLAALIAPAASAQQPPKPGPEHEVLKKHVGTWDATMKMEGMESKGVATYKMDLGELWLVSTFEGDFGGMKFSGRGLDTYDPAKKKYVGLWVDSMSTSPMLMEGTYDKEKKTMTMTGEGPGMDGKPTKFKAVSVMPDDDTINFNMYMGDAPQPAFTILYKRKK